MCVSGFMRMVSVTLLANRVVSRHIESLQTFVLCLQGLNLNHGVLRSWWHFLVLRSQVYFVP
jgi:hypothetical protein